VGFYSTPFLCYLFTGHFMLRTFLCHKSLMLVSILQAAVFEFPSTPAWAWIVTPHIIESVVVRRSARRR
jgi:hypothetical protein